MNNASQNVQMADRLLTGMSANAIATLGLGVTHSTTYNDGGTAVHSTDRTIGAGLEASTTRDLVNLGSKVDGRYFEGCAGAVGFIQICGSYSWSGKSFYFFAKVDTGAGLSVADGWKNTLDYVLEK